MSAALGSRARRRFGDETAKESVRLPRHTAPRDDLVVAKTRANETGGRCATSRSPARPRATTRARERRPTDDALSVRLDAIQRAVDDALETFSTRLRNVKDAVSADANKATQLARASRRELEEMANALDAMTERHERRIEALERAVKAERKAVATRDADDRVTRFGEDDIDSAVKRSKSVVDAGERGVRGVAGGGARNRRSAGRTTMATATAVAKARKRRERETMDAGDVRDVRRGGGGRDDARGARARGVVGCILDGRSPRRSCMTTRA